MGFSIETQPDKGADSTDVNLFVGEFSDGTIDWTGLYLSNSGTVLNKRTGAYKHLAYETTDSTFRLFNNSLIFDNEAVPSTTSSATSVMKWTGDGTKADPVATRTETGVTAISTPASSVAISFPANMPDATYSVQMTVEVTGGTPSVGERVVAVSSGTIATTGFTAELVEALDAGETLNIHWTVTDY